MTRFDPPFDADALAWDKQDGLLPAVVQDARTHRVLMLGYMDRAALAQTLDGGHVTFFSRSKGRLWTKGETSGHVLALVSIAADCDGDALLVRATPHGPTCHLGHASCFDTHAATTGQGTAMLGVLDRLLEARETERPAGSYTTSLFESGLPRMAQKVGEEGVETALAAVTADDAALLGEAADLAYHLLVLLRARGLGLDALEDTLRARHGRPPRDG